MNDIFAHGAMIALFLFVALGLSTAQMGVTWTRMKEFFGKFIENDPYDS